MEEYSSFCGEIFEYGISVYKFKRSEGAHGCNG
jgi:hypothetical protein